MNHQAVGMFEVVRNTFSSLQDAMPQFSPLVGEIMSAPVLLLAAAVIIFLGPTMDKSADAVFEAVGKVWTSMLNLKQKKNLHQSCRKSFLKQVGDSQILNPLLSPTFFILELKIKHHWHSHDANSNTDW